MPLEKPKKPTELVPRAFGGIKNNFSDDLQSTGFEPNIPQTYNGDNLNYHLDATGKELDYVEKVVDFINQAPVNHIPFVNENNQLDYVDASSLGSGAFDMFDTKISDHILTDKEAKGWALQGTYVYKNGGTNRLGYPDFYNKCLEEYQNSANQGITTPWVQPKATGETTAINGGDMVITASSFEGSYYPYLALDGEHSTSSYMWSANSTTSGWWQIKFPYLIKITGLTFYQKYSSGNYFTKDARFYTSSDMSTPIGDAFVGASSNYTPTEIQNIPAGGIITDTIYLNITSSHGTNVGMSDLKITAEKVIAGTKTNPNGHKFYPISEKSTIDEIYEQYGIADFYGIDEENERIFLPRNKWFSIKGSTDTVPVYGNGKTLGMMDGSKTTGLISLAGLSGVTDAGTLRGVGVAGTKVGTGASTSNPLSNQYVGVTTDPNLSGLIADTSNVVQPDENKYLYYCVGNTQVTSAVTNVTEITTSENDTLPWGYNFYSGDLLEESAGYVKSLGQWNRGNDWESFYDRAVKKIGQPFADGYIKAHTEEYNDFDLVINQDEMTFRLPLLNGEENIVSDKYEDWELKASVSNYTAPANGMIQLTKRAGTANAYITMWSDLNGQQLNNSCPTSGGSVSATMELTKGETFNVGYSASGDTVRFRFIYFKGNGNLYFKLANAVQNLELLNVGEVMEAVADKISRQECKAYIVETYKNGASWYRVWSDGWCEQGGESSSSTESLTVTFLKTFANTNYNVNITPFVGGSASNYNPNITSVTTTGFAYDSNVAKAFKGRWQASGYIV